MEIAVDVGPPIKGYSSAAAAIAGAKGHPRQIKAKQDAQPFFGRRFVAVRCSLTEWSVEFTDSLWVEVFCEGDEVEWRVSQSPKTFTHIEQAYTYVWPSGNRGVIDPAQIVADRSGAGFKRFWVNESGFYIYLLHRPLLAFHPLQRRGQDDCVLWVGNEE
jgi:hypothetical protein